MSRVVLVTGVARDVGARFARALAATEGYEVIGLDVTSPRHELGAVNHVRADVRSPLVQRLVSDRAVDTVVHLGLIDGGQSRASAKEANVIGTMQLLAACQKAESVSKLVLMSSAVVYGSGPLAPARFTEPMARRTPDSPGFASDCLEAESYVDGLALRRPDVTATTLRLANLMGAGVDSPLTRYLSSAVVLRPLGFDARLQFLHPADAVTALLAVVERDLPGTYNVGADDVVTLTQAVRTLGRPSLGVLPDLPPAAWSLGRRLGLTSVTADQFRGVMFGRAMDTSRFAEATDFTPHYSSRRALDEFAALGEPGLLSIDKVDRALDAAARMLAPAPGRRTHG
ncbi:NAD-dependent epimerase/dehydratase family protein [Mariniluteicoccus flavus]